MNVIYLYSIEIHTIFALYLISIIFVGFQITSPASGTLYECKNPYNQWIIRVFLFLAETLLKLFIFRYVFSTEKKFFRKVVFSYSY